MTFAKSLLFAAAALTSLGACTTTDMPGQAAAVQAMAPVAAKSALDAAIEAAGGQAALAKVKELYWVGSAATVVDGKASKINVMTVVRPDGKWGRATTWADGAEPKTARTLQVEQGKAWDVSRQAWNPMPVAQANNENDKFALYTLMLLTPLKETAAKAEELPTGADGARTIKTQLATGQVAELTVDASGKLVGARHTVRDAKGGADIVETAKFSGEIVSNGVKWPKRITIEQNGAPFYDLEIATFEAAAAHTPRPLEQAMQYEGGQNNAGDENAG